mgnify:CR=1 FL=1
MTGKTHMAIGVAAGLTLSIGQPIENQVLLMAASAIGSLIPDLDHPKSKLNQKILIINNNFIRALFYISIGIGLIYLGVATRNNVFRLLGTTMIMVGISSHRSFTHSLLGFILFASIVYLTSFKYGLSEVYKGFDIGYILHLVLDFFTPMGIQLFFPLDKHISSPITIKSNGLLEHIILIGSNVYSICLFLQGAKII